MSRRTTTVTLRNVIASWRAITATLRTIMAAPRTVTENLGFKLDRGWTQSTRNTARKASCGISTRPTRFIRFLPSFCFSKSFRLREMSPP